MNTLTDHERKVLAKMMENQCELLRMEIQSDLREETDKMLAEVNELLPQMTLGRALGRK